MAPSQITHIRSMVKENNRPHNRQASSLFSNLRAVREILKFSGRKTENQNFPCFYIFKAKAEVNNYSCKKKPLSFNKHKWIFKKYFTRYELSNLFLWDHFVRHVIIVACFQITYLNNSWFDIIAKPAKAKSIGIIESV